MIPVLTCLPGGNAHRVVQPSVQECCDNKHPFPHQSFNTSSHERSELHIKHKLRNGVERICESQRADFGSKADGLGLECQLRRLHTVQNSRNQPPVVQSHRSIVHVQAPGRPLRRAASSSRRLVTPSHRPVSSLRRPVSSSRRRCKLAFGSMDCRARTKAKTMQAERARRGGRSATMRVQEFPQQAH